MIRYENQCVDCPQELRRGCYGCSKKNVPVYICDWCENEVDTLYDFEGDQVCEDCIIESLDVVVD